MSRKAARAGASSNTSTDSPALRLKLLGASSWTLGTARAVPLERRDAGVLAYLALEGPTPRATLIQLLWPDAPRGAGRNHFRQRLHRLRKAVGVDPIEGAEMLSIAAMIAVDVRDLPSSEAAGELLPGLDYSDCPQFEAWLTQQRTRVQRAHVEALITKASQREGEGRFAEAISIAEQLVALAPLEEHAHRRLMHLHYLRGDRAAAIAAFERCERLIKDELGARPGAETLALLATIESAPGSVVVAPARPVPSSILRPPRMIGRAAEIAEAVAAWNAHRVVWVVGAGGLGKSRLLAELGATVECTVAVRAHPGDSTVPYALLARWLRALEQRHPEALTAARPEVLAALLPERPKCGEVAKASTAAIRSTCERVLGAALRDGLKACIVDDVHHADAASLELFAPLMLAEALEACRWALARRPGEGDVVADPLAGTIADVHRLVIVRLTPLNEADIAALVDSLGLPAVNGERMAGPLARHTGGNPLFVLETLKQAVSSGDFDGRRLPRPLGVVESIQRRVAALSAASQSLVQLAAVAGPDFSVSLAEAVLDSSALALAADWRELESAQLIDGEAFVHDLVHEAILDWVPRPIRRHLCGAIAAFLATRNGDPARIADHWVAAGDDAQAAPALVAAAAAARRAGRFVEAGQRSEQAAGAYDRLGCEAQAFEQLHRALGDTTSRVVVERLGLELGRRARGNEQHAVAALARAELANLDCDWEAMETALGQAMDAARRGSDRAVEAEVHFGLGALLHYRGEFTDAIEQISAACQLLAAERASVRQAEIRGSLARVLFLAGRLAEAAGELDKAIPVLRDANDSSELAVDFAFRAVLALEAGDATTALDFSRQAYSVAADTDLGARDWLAVMDHRLRVLAAASHYDEALELICTVRADPRFAPNPLQARIIETEALILFELGRGWQAERLIEPLPAIDGGIADYRGSRAVLALHGEAIQARPVGANRLDSVRGQIGSVPQRCRYAALAAPHLPPPAALQLCNAALELAEGLGLKAHLAGLLAGRADALRRSGEAGEIRRCAERALRLLDQTTPVIYRGSIWLSLHDALAAAGDAALAREALMQASEWIHHTARRHVPPQFRDSFLSRNAINRKLLLLSIRAAIAPPGALPAGGA